MRKDDLIRLRHMLDAAREAALFAKNKTRSSLEYLSTSIMRILKDFKNAIIGNKSASILLLVGIIIVIYSLLILIDWAGPTAIDDKKFISIYENIYLNTGVAAGTILVDGMYQSKGVISSNKDVEFFIFNMRYDIIKDASKDGIVGKANIWPDNITAEICPDNTKMGDRDPCIKVLLEKSGDDGSLIEYSNRTDLKKNIEFLSSGRKTLRIGSIISHNKENVFEIEPYNTYLQIQLQKYMYILALLGFVITIFQFYDFWIKYFKK